jgi:hypothetical protein
MPALQHLAVYDLPVNGEDLPGCVIDELPLDVREAGVADAAA